MSTYVGDYSKHPLPYGAGSTRGMTQRHYEAIADTLRNRYVRVATEFGDDSLAAQVIRDMINDLATRFGSGNDRFRTGTFVNAATDAARNNSDK